MSSLIHTSLIPTATKLLVQLAIKPHFDALSQQEKKYAHYISRASFAGTRINLRQCSPESEGIFDLVLALHSSCNGEYWQLIFVEALVF
jgi:dipeptidyl-peptidase-3